MSSDTTITQEQFIKRLINLCLRSGLDSFPKDDANQQILLKSAILMVGQAEVFTEKEIGAKLEVWCTDICPINFFDRVTLRRYLVDSGYLTRSSDGSRYQVAQPGPRPNLFEPAIDQLDILQVLQNARAEIERKKKEYQQKAKVG
jgi:hypothetical protein